MQCTVQVNEDLEFLDKVLEISEHPSWQDSIDEAATTVFLQNKPSMTYILRQDEKGKYDYWLSHKKSNGEIHHRHFTIRLFPDGYFFANYLAPPCESLDNFIKGALACKD